MPGRGFQPPAPVGEPYRADPSGPAPFVREGEPVPVVPVEPAVEPNPGRPVPSPPYAYPQPQSDATTPQFRQPGTVQRSTAPMSADERFARVSLWIGVASIFVFNLFLGPVAIVRGVMSIRRGEKRLGQLALVYGLLGTVIGIAYIALVAAGVLPTFNQMLTDIRNGKQP